MSVGKFFFDKPIEGEAIPFDPFVIIPFGGLGVSSAARTGFRDIERLFANAFKTEEKIIAEKLTSKGAITFVKPVKPGGNILDDISESIKKGLANARNRQTNVKLPAVAVPSVSGGTKALIGTGILGTTASIGILSLTEGGQNVVTTTRDISKDVSGFGQGVTQFFQQNPLLLAGIVIVVGIMVVKK